MVWIEVTGTDGKGKLLKNVYQAVGQNFRVDSNGDIPITLNGDMLMNRCNSLPAFESGRRHILT